MLKTIRNAALWILLTPGALWLGGVASNQAVLNANQDKFPVMWNEFKINRYAAELVIATHDKDKIVAENAQFMLDALNAGYLDDTHCIMTPKTHLNWLADVFDIKGDGVYSIGDFMQYVGEWAYTFVPFVWGFEVIRRLRQKEDHY